MKSEFVIDLKGVRTARSLHTRLKAALPLPEGYGRNYDAWHDVLTEYGPNWRLVFENAATVPETFRTVCADAAEETPGLEIVFAPTPAVRRAKK